MASTQQDTQQLLQKLQALGRDVYAKKGLAYQHFVVDGETLIEGEHKERCAERISWIERIDLTGKTVLDLGCNLGLFAVEAARRGAGRAMGIDIQDTVICAANLIREHLNLDNCRFEVADLMTAAGRDAVQPTDIVFAFAVYDHLTDRHKDVHPAERENGYLDITEWLARITREFLIVEFHNHQKKWEGFFRQVLVEHGFDVQEEKVTTIERPVFFCRRTDQAHDELIIDGQRFRRVKSWHKRRRKLYVLEKDGESFFCKRYATRDLEEGHQPCREAAILQEFADCPEVLQPYVFDDRRIVLPYFDGKPLEVIDSQPVEAAVMETPACRFRVLSLLTGFLAKYMERRELLVEKYSSWVPEIYREEVRTGARMLVDVSPSNILISPRGDVRLVDFEPTKPALTETVVANLKRLCEGAAPSTKRGLLSTLLRGGGR
jgi:SAM-dependent methyltransferase